MLSWSGANVNAKNNYNTTALFFAAWNNDLPILDVLIRAGKKTY